MRHASIWGLLIGLLALPVLSESVIRYVDKDVSCPGTGDTASPYCSIQNALNVVNAGDIVRIRNSATPYNEEAMLTRSGALGNPIIIEPDVGHTPNLQRTNANAVNGALNVYNASHVTIQNLLFDNTGITASPRAGLLLRTTTTNMSGLRVLNNTFTGWGGNAANAAVVSSTGDPRGALIINSGYWSVTPFLEIRGTLVQGNTFTNNRQSAITVLYGPDTIMENNTITGTLCGHDTDTARNTMGIKVIACNFGNGCATNHIIRNNVIHDFEPMTSCGVTHSPGAFDTPAGIWCDVGLNNGLVEGNTVYNINQTASGVPNDSTGDSAGIYIEHNCNNWIVRNNLVHHIGQNGIKIRIANITQTPSTYLNNTVYSTWKGVRIMDGRFIMKNNILFDHSLAGIAFDSAQTLNLADINYNLFWDTTGGGAKVGAWGGGVMNFATWKSTTGYDLNSQNIDPRLANVGTADFRLCTAAATPDPSCVGASPAINAGTNVGIAFNGSAPDQGAIETGGAASTPAALWRLDETGTTTTAPDSSGNNTHLTLCNTTTCPQQGPTWIAGSVNNAASFDGTSDYMEVANSPFLEFTGDMTFAAWVGTTSAANQMLVSKENISACGTPYLFEMTAQQYSYYHCGPGSDEIVLFDAYTIPTDGVRHHVAMVRTITSPARTVRLYIDGVLTQTETWVAAGPATNTVSLRLGKSHVTGDPRWLVGSLDEVRLVNHAMTASEILALAEEGDVTPPPFTGMSTTHHKFYSADKVEGAKPLSAEDGSANIRVDGKFRLRFGIANETGVGVTSQIYPLKCQVEADPIFSVTNSCTTNPVCLTTDTRVVNNANTTRLLTLDSPLTFTPGAFINGAIPPWPTRTLADDDTLEHEYSLKLSGVTAGEDVCCWPVFGSAETLFDSYTPAAGACWVVTAGKQVHR